jgi:hypothetical protein
MTPVKRRILCSQPEDGRYNGIESLLFHAFRYAVPRTMEDAVQQCPVDLVLHAYIRPVLEL